MKILLHSIQLIIFSWIAHCDEILDLHAERLDLDAQSTSAIFYCVQEK